jgi:DNA-binding beta-propeller fold protein YncE
MNVMWKAACAAALIAATFIEIGCGDVYRPVTTPLPVTSGNPAGAETEVVLNQCPTPGACLNGATGTHSDSVLTAIDVSGDTNVGNKPLENQVASVVGPVAGSMAIPLAFDSGRTTVFSANAEQVLGGQVFDSVTQVLLNSSTAGFSANTTTITLEPGSKPVGISFQYFGITYTQDYVVNSGTTPTCATGGSLAAIAQPSDLLTATICLGANANPVYAWIYKDQTKVFVLDNQPGGSSGIVHVVSASKYEVTHSFPVGVNPIKAAQSNNGQYIYVLNNGDNSISIIDGQAETVGSNPISTHITSAGPVADALTNSPPVDIAMDTNFNDTTANTQINHVWILHANGTVSVFDGTTPGTLTWITSIATGGTPTNLALLRDGTWAYVGLAGTDKIVGIDTSKLAGPGAVTSNATTTVRVGVHRSEVATLTNNINPAAPVSGTVMVETTTPTVSSVAVSRQGDSADLSKVYATTTTNTTYYCYDQNLAPTDCANSDPWSDGTPIAALPPASPFLASGCTDLGLISIGTGAGLFGMSCPNLYNGVAVVSAAGIGAVTEGNTVIVPAVPVNSYITTIPAPNVVTYCNPGNPETGEYDGQKNCPSMIPVTVLGRS